MKLREKTVEEKLGHVLFELAAIRVILTGPLTDMRAKYEMERAKSIQWQVLYEEAMDKFEREKLNNGQCIHDGCFECSEQD